MYVDCIKIIFEGLIFVDIRLIWITNAIHIYFFINYYI
jgi:hypothetical protein